MNAHAKYCSFSFLVLGLSMPLVFGQPVPCDAAGPVGPSSVLPWPWWQHTESSYIIYTDGKEYFSQDGATGRIFCRDVDARTVIQDTIDAVADGGRIFLKPGEYTISATHLILDDNLLIEGSQAAVLTSDPNAPTMIMNAQGKANITIAGLTFRDCAAEAIRFKGGADIRILNCRFENIQKDAIVNFTDPLERVWIENCLIDAAGLAADSSGSPNYTGIRLKQTRDIFIRNNVVQFCGSTGIAGGGLAGLPSTSHVAGVLPPPRPNGRTAKPSPGVRPVRVRSTGTTGPVSQASTNSYAGRCWARCCAGCVTRGCCDFARPLEW